MTQSAQYTLTGISAMRRTRGVSSAMSSFVKASKAMSEFESAFATYQQSIGTR
jgi:hypothetical protein